jgi:predicted lipoprotein with Yx(FWY)xxD motif
MKNVLSLVMLFMFIVSCSSDDDYTNDPEVVIDDPVAVVENSVRLSVDSAFGNVLTNAAGFTLYFFAPDSKGNSNCNDGCATTWPAFNTSELTLDDGLAANDFSTITRIDGTEQTTYKGWPLYLFSNDTAANQINGDGAGGVWFVAKPDYSIMIAKSQLVGRNADGIESNLNSSFEAGDEETYYITDDTGNTLYHFINDENGTNNFTNPDFSNNGVWQVLNT